MRKQRIFPRKGWKTGIIIFLFYLPVGLLAQCGSPVIVTPASPYVEDFELNNGGWTTGGTASDWAWGTPAKPVINGAGSGSKCWIVGGLTSSSYNNGERSWVQSPCLNISALSHPYINFLVFWESEQKFDGSSLQYSIDNAVTWNTVGSSTDASKNAFLLMNQPIIRPFISFIN